MLSSVDNIEAWNGKNIGGGVSSNVSIMLPKRNSLGGGSGLTGSEGDWGLIEMRDKSGW